MKKTTVLTFRHSSSDRVPDALTYKNTRNGVNVVVSRRHDGDMHPGHVSSSVLERRRQAVLPGRWTQLAQWHSADVVEVDTPGEHDGALGDVAVTTAPSAVLGIWTGDCAPIVLATADGSRLVAAHAGWRGLVRGVLQEAVRALGDTRDATVVCGPMIGACCYEFSVDDRDVVADALGMTHLAEDPPTRAGNALNGVHGTVRIFRDGEGWLAGGIHVLGGHLVGGEQTGENLILPDEAPFPMGNRDHVLRTKLKLREPG